MIVDTFSNKLPARFIAVVLLIIAVAGTGYADDAMNLAFFLDRLGGENSWLAPLDSEHAYMASSNQPVYRRDCNAFLRTEEENGKVWKVLVDLDGPGVISRFWTAGDFDGALRITIDSSTVITTTLGEFFGGKCRPFARPLVLDDSVSSGGRVSYFPIPFARHITIKSDSDSDSFYWQINYSLFSRGAVESYTGSLSFIDQAALERVSMRFRGYASSVAPAARRETFRLAIAVDDTAGCTVQGEGVVRSLVVTMPEDGWGHARDLTLQVYSDGLPDPDVDVGLLDLVHLYSKVRSYSSMYSSFDGRTMTFLMPVPCKTGIEFRLRNSGGFIFRNIEMRVSLDERSFSPMRLHAKTWNEKPEFGKLITLANITGTGVFAGLNLIASAPAEVGDAYFNQEGNEYITLDNGTRTVWRGTGTEDYFNCGYYYKNGEAALPLHGCLDKRPDGGGVASCYRIQKLDAVPFRNGILVSIEPGCPKKGRDLIGKLTLDYRWTCFWYSPVVESDR